MYQLLCSAQTQIGRETLACWMKSPARLEEIYARQQAVAELRTRRNLPEAVAAVAPTSDRWRCRYGAQMLEWVAVLGELEALLSVSTYSYEHPGAYFQKWLAAGRSSIPKESGIRFWTRALA
jgi:hypothetical protein